MTNEPKKECCKKCLSSKYALKGKMKEKFRGICGVTCECHWPESSQELQGILQAFDKECCEFLDSGVHIDYEKTIDLITQAYYQGQESWSLSSFHQAQKLPEAKNQALSDISQAIGKQP